MGAALALTLGFSCPRTPCVGDDPPAPAAGPDAEQVAALAHAEKIDAQLVELYMQGKYGEATALARESLAIRERARPADHPDVALSLNNLALLLKAQGVYAEARALYARALAIRERALGAAHPDVAQSLNNLAMLLQEQGAYAEARRLYERALAIREETLAKEDPFLAQGLNNLANMLQSLGAYAEARPLYERALAIYEKAYGPEHVVVAATLNNMATLLCDQGAYAEARPLGERALAIREKALAPNHPEVAGSANQLAVILEALGANAEARLLYERALAMNEKSLGGDHPAVARCLDALGSFLKERGAYGEARIAFDRALAIREKAFGGDHPLVASTLGNLALLLRAQRVPAEARLLFERALAVDERLFGSDHPHTVTGLNNLAMSFEEAGDYAAARPLFERMLAISEAETRTRLAALSPRQRLGLLRSTRFRLDNWVRFAPKAGLSGYPEVLRFRGLVARAEAAERVLARHATGDELRAQESLQAAHRRAARLANEGPSSSEPQARARWQKAYAEATAERERLTLALSERSAPLRMAHERLDLKLADVQASLEPDVAIVDFLRVGERYLAWVVGKTGEPTRIEVGESEAIEAASRQFVEAIARKQGDASAAAAQEAAGAALRALGWRPIETALGTSVRRVVICPDAALAAVPFGALPGREVGRYLLDDLPISYVMNAQDLVPRKEAPPVGTGALLVGGVDYGRAEATSSVQPPAPATGERAPRGISFAPLSETRLEAESLGERLGTNAATLLLGAEATEARLRQAAKGKRLIHIATHGFAREDLLARLHTRAIEEVFTSADMERQLSAGHDPMLLAGLALAGANPRDGAGGDDGILTALEASYLDLDGVDLVTLSACETARGTVESGEGVQGLVQAFQMAGARAVVASLWRVDDEATRRLMQGFYARMLRAEAPLAPPDALREAAQALRDSKDAQGKARFAAPRYWAAFVAYGR